MFGPVQIQIVVNLIACIVVGFLGYIHYQRIRNPLPLYIGVAFWLFSITYLAALLNLAGKYSDFLILVQGLAYIVVIFALYTDFKGGGSGKKKKRR